MFDGVGKFFGKEEGAFLSEVFSLGFEEKSLGFGLGVFGRSELPDNPCDGFSVGIAIAARHQPSDSEETGSSAVGIGEGAESRVVELDYTCLVGEGSG